ncbi:electron transfer flavoprotein subunit beta/FixA family protein [candidate division KSB1 bacterium]|nr:electron transfer flavoprotein subunit beta/FixA family protein [candidate division KSB1 bacterium]
MKIVVCVKQVPDTEARIKIAGDKKSIDPTDINWILNPYDEFAVEEALQIKEKSGDAQIIVVSVGPERVVSALRSALAMGADDAVLVKTDDVYLDSITTAKALAEALKDMEYDLLLFGKQGVDDDSLAVGPMVAELLGVGCVTRVTDLTVADGAIEAKREIEGGAEVVTAKLPAAITAEKGLNEPRYPALRGIMMAKRKPIPEKQVALAAPKLKIRALEYPPSRQAGKIVGEGVDAVPELVKLLREEAKAI